MYTTNKNIIKNKNMKVYNMVSNKGHTIANQFEIIDGNKRIFQSYSSTIAVIENGKITLGKDWDYSNTTRKYRNMFLGMTSNELKAKINSGEIVINENL